MGLEKKPSRGNHLKVHRWEPGSSPYADWLKTLTEDERAAHMEARAKRKSMKQAMKSVVEQYQTQWVTELHNAAWAQLVKARDSGDAQSFVAVWDRIIGRPEEQHTVDLPRALPWSDKDL